MPATPSAKSYFSISLAAASALGAGSVLAADLPIQKAAPVDYVRTCISPGQGGSPLRPPSEKAGFFYIPGTDTCLEIGGRVRAEYRYLEPFVRGGDTSGFRARGRITLDARTATSYGTLRTFIIYEITRNTGNYNSAVSTPNPPGPNIVTPAASTDTANLKRGFIQFGGFTAGKVNSFYDPFGVVQWGGFSGYSDSDNAVEPVLFAYTHSFGSGFSTTVSFEEPSVFRSGAAFAGIPAAGSLVYAGQEVPDIVANIRATGSWGLFQIAGVAHQLRAMNVVPAGNPNAGAPVDDEFGFGVQAGLRLNVPGGARQDSLALVGVYSQGSVIRAGYSNPFAVSQTNAGPQFALVDAFIDSAGRMRQAETWSAYGAYTHNWTPEWRSSIFGSYGQVDYAEAAGSPATLFDSRYYQVGGHLVWSPVTALDIGVEIVYRNIGTQNGLVVVDPNTGIAFRRADAIEGRFRVQRDF